MGIDNINRGAVDVDLPLIDAAKQTALFEEKLFIMVLNQEISMVFTSLRI